MPLIVKPISAHIEKGKQYLFFNIDPYVICIIGNQRIQSRADKNGGK
jgi:hypothetical protein